MCIRDRGKIVNDLMCKNFPDIVNIQFAADMEEKLDDVENGQVDWHAVVRDFYGPFEKDLEKAEASIEKVSPSKTRCPISPVRSAGR